MTPPDLDRWVAKPAIRVSHRRRSAVAPDRLWEAAQSVTLRETSVLGRLIRWRIPGISADISFEELFRNPPFLVLHETERVLVSGLVGRIWTLRRDYPQPASAEEYLDFSQRGTARVVFAHWVQPDPDGERPPSPPRCASRRSAPRVGWESPRSDRWSARFTR